MLLCHQCLLSRELRVYTLGPGSFINVPLPSINTSISRSLTHLLLNLAPNVPQGLLENFVLGLQAHTSLQVKDSLVEAAQLL